jgi:protein phosphatase
VLLVGPAGSGKSTFARCHFKPTEILSSDFFRGMVSDNEANQAASADAFELLHLATTKRLARGRFTVIDATNLNPDARKPLLKLARDYHVQTAAIVFDLPAELCQQRSQGRAERVVEADVVATQAERMPAVRDALEKERFKEIFILSSLEEVEHVQVQRHRLPVNRRHEFGPFDIIGDVHGCFDELMALLTQLGYRISDEADAAGNCRRQVLPPEGRKLVFVGDLVDRGPKISEVLRLVIGLVQSGQALCVLGNHDDKLRRKLEGRDVRVTHGLAESLAQLEQEGPEFREQVYLFLEQLPTHYVLDRDNLVVAHAGLKRELQGRVSGEVRSFALFGDTTGETDAYGLPQRRNWGAEYAGRAHVVYGHTPVAEAAWLNRTINIDTGCVFGGKLTALRYPEMELVSVPALREYARPNRPFLPQHDATNSSPGANPPTGGV